MPKGVYQRPVNANGKPRLTTNQRYCRTCTRGFKNHQGWRLHTQKKHPLLWAELEALLAEQEAMDQRAKDAELAANVRGETTEEEIPVEPAPEPELVPIVAPEPVPQTSEEEETPAVVPVSVHSSSSRPAPRHLHIPPRAGLGAGGRTVKLLRAVCHSCQPEQIFDVSWVPGCLAKGHDPFYTDVENVETRNVYEEELDTSGRSTGRRRVTGTEQHVWITRQPNTDQIELSIRINSGQAVDWRLDSGAWIKPENHPTDPLLPFCQYVGCWSQDIRYRTRHGEYCSEMQAKMVQADELGKPRLEVVNEQKRAEQFASMSLQVV